jgi:16S rRNA processing protein RimM
VAGAFGVRGELRITAFSADPLALLAYRDLKAEDGGSVLTLTSGRAIKGGIAARAREVETCEQAEALRGLQLFVPRDALAPPEDDEFYVADLLGLEVRGPDGAALGRVRAVENFGAGDVVEIAPTDGPSWWLAFTLATVPEVRIDEGYLIAIRPPEDEAISPDRAAEPGPPAPSKRRGRPTR